MSVTSNDAVQLQIDEIEWFSRDHVPGSYKAPAVGSVLKILRDETAEGGVVTKMIKLPPGWVDSTLHWHTFEEEMFLIEGEMTFFEQHFHAPAYFLVPPRVIHGHVVSKEGATLIQRFAGPIDMNFVDSYDADLDAD